MNFQKFPILNKSPKRWGYSHSLPCPPQLRPLLMLIPRRQACITPKKIHSFVFCLFPNQWNSLWVWSIIHIIIGLLSQIELGTYTYWINFYQSNALKLINQCFFKIPNFSTEFFISNVMFFFQEKFWVSKWCEKKGTWNQEKSKNVYDSFLH